MKIEHAPISAIKRDLLSVIGKYLDIAHYKVFFFGSRVLGKNDERSDIDVGIEGKKPVPGHILCEIREEISDLPILYTVDFVDFRRVSPEFRKVALKNVEYFT